MKNKSAEAATYKFTTSNPGEYTARAQLFSGNDALSQDSATVLFMQRKSGGTVYVVDTSNNISFRIDDGIYGVIPKGTVVKKNGNKVNSISYDVLSAGGSQVSRLKFRPEGANFEGDSMYFVHELGTVFGGDPQVLSATRTNADGSVDIMQSAAGDPAIMSAAGNPIMTTAAGDPIMTAAAGDPIMTSAAGDPIMTSAAGDPIMSAAAGDPIMTSAAGDPIMLAAAGDPIMMGTSSSTMISQTNHYSTFTVESANLPVSVENLVARWCDGSFYRNYDPIAFIRKGVEDYKPAGADKTDLISYLNCEKFADLGSDLYELINKPVGFQRNLNLIENLFFVSEFYNRMKARQEGGTFVAVKNGLELRSAIAALYTATTSYNRSTTFADLTDSSLIPLTYSGVTPKDYSSKVISALNGNSGTADIYAATKKEMMIFANYITTSSKGPDFTSVETLLTPDQLVCAWFNPDTPASNCNKIYTLNAAGHVALGETEVSVAEANALFTKFFMPMNSRLSESEKLDLFRTFYLALKYAGTIFFGGSDFDELNDALLKTAYLVFDGINGNMNAVTITDTFEASAHTVSVLDGAEMATVPYLTKLSALTDQITLKVVAASADVEKVLISIEGKEFEKVQENTRTYYKQTGNLKKKSIVLTPGTLSQGETSIKTLLGSENVDELGNITGKLTIIANSKISGKTYTTQKSYDFFVNGESDGVNSKEVPANIQIFVNDSTGHAIPANANPTIILNPGNKVFYSETGMISLENLTPAAYTIDAFADGYYAKNVSVNVPAGATFSVEIRLDEELTSTSDANLELNISINTVKHPSKVYVQIYNDNMDLVANETARFNDPENTYDPINIEMNSGRYTLLAVGEDMYRYLEAITLYEGENVKTITIVAKNACGNGIVDSAEECEPSVEGSTLEVFCGEIYPASTYPEKTAACDPATCTFNKTECGKAALCGDGIIDKPSEACDGGSKACAEIAGFGSSSGSAPCADDCSGYITANNCSKATESCGNLPANALWNDGLGTFAQIHNGEDWLPATKSATFGTTKEECLFSCAKGYKWNGSICEQYPLSLALICTGEKECFENTEETECPVYGTYFFGQDAQYAAAGFCMPHTLTAAGNGTVKDAYTHYEWQASSSTAMNWTQANKYCSDLNNESGSSVFWRIPNPTELLTIIDSGTSSPALGGIFTAKGHTFWASEDNRNGGNAWRVDENGALASVAKTTPNSVLCVRTNDYDAIENRFTATNETVKDNVSGLMWQKQPVASRTWAEALNYCEEVSTADKFDWRLPNRNELASLVNYEKSNGAISDFPGIAEKGFWSSTSSLTGNEAWTVDFETGKIEASDKTDIKYIICVRNDEPCLGGECADPCSFNACREDGNSTGLCTASDYSFTCGCKSGFNWKYGKCLLATTRYIACEGLPENAVWNSVFGISQNYDGNKWYPSEVGTFNKNPSNTECRFVCATNYKWDADEEKCLPESRISKCSEKKPYSVWNIVSKISQTWDGEKWIPSSESEYNIIPSEEECRFICKEHYTWDSENNICNVETREVDCEELPANALWWESSTVIQTWNDVYNDWYPAALATYKSDGSDGENGCFFKCETNYKWNQAYLKCEPQTKYNVACNSATLPENAEWNMFATVNQTWSGADWDWIPSTTGTYNETPDPDECRYKCKTNYTWNTKTKECVADSRQTACVKNVPHTSWWNDVSTITQTWNGATQEWLPTTAGIYSDSAVDNECRFKCDVNYTWNDSGECVADIHENVACNNDTLPENAVWWNSTTTQIWNGVDWTPTTLGSYKSDMPTENGCYFKCKTNHNWNQAYRMCEAESKYNVACTDLPEHAVWNIFTTVNQTWNSSIGNNGDWYPPTTGTYNETPDPNECRFKCQDNYFWEDFECISLCETAANNCGEHSVCKATSVDTFECECESGYVKKDEQCQERMSWSFEDAREDTSSGKISVDNSAQYHWVRSDALGAKTGEFAMCSNNYHVQNSTAVMTITVDMPIRGVLSFYIKGYTAGDPWDTLKFYVDGNLMLEEQLGWSDWTQKNVTLTAGVHTLEFSAYKNYQLDAGDDRYCIDLLEITTIPECDPYSTTPCYDTTSGLIWSERSSNDMTWDAAAAYCNNSSEAGLSGWYLPNVNEIRTLFLNCSSTVGIGGDCPFQDPDNLPYNYNPNDCVCRSNDGVYHYTFGKITEDLWTSSVISDYSSAIASQTHQSLNRVLLTINPQDSSNSVRCVKQICSAWELWTGSSCDVNPCNTDPCAADPHSTGGCTATASDQYSCGCETGYVWAAFHCVAETDYWSFENDEDDTSSGSVSVDNSATYHWERMTTLGAKAGSYAMCSNNYNVSNSIAEMTVTVNMPADGSLSFYIKGKGENNNTSNYDTFKLYVDETETLTSQVVNYDSSSGTTGWPGWTLQSIDLTEGTHTLSFQYKKDGSVNKGDDRFCIDDLSIAW